MFRQVQILPKATDSSHPSQQVRHVIYGRKKSQSLTQLLLPKKCMTSIVTLGYSWLQVDLYLQEQRMAILDSQEIS